MPRRQDALPAAAADDRAAQVLGDLLDQWRAFRRPGADPDQGSFRFREQPGRARQLAGVARRGRVRCRFHQPDFLLGPEYVRTDLQDDGPSARGGLR